MLHITHHACQRARQRCAPLARMADAPLRAALHELARGGLPWGAQHDGGQLIACQGLVDGRPLRCVLACSLDPAQGWVVTTVLSEEQARADLDRLSQDRRRAARRQRHIRRRAGRRRQRRRELMSRRKHQQASPPTALRPEALVHLA